MRTAEKGGVSPAAPFWQVWTFGCGTALPGVERDNTYLLLEAGPECWLIDCGASPYQRLLRAGVEPSSLCGAILTHDHPDHIYGLPALLFQLSLAGYEGVFEIVGLEETLALARRVVEAFDLGRHCVPCEWRAVEVGEEELGLVVEGQLVRVWVGRVVHSRPALGVRLEGRWGGVVAYSGDTERCPGVVRLAQGADWLLHECTAAEPVPGHSTPEDVAAVALATEVNAVGILHYDPLYIVGEEELLERVRRAGMGGRVVVLGDMDRVGYSP